MDYFCRVIKSFDWPRLSILLIVIGPLPNAFCSHMAYIHCTLHAFKNWKQHMFETNLYFVLLRHKLAYVKIKMLIDVDSYTWIYLGMDEIISFGECLKALRIV